MIHIRKQRGLTKSEMATRLGISRGLLRIVEEGGVTHPNIAARMQTEYGLDDLQTEDIIPLCRRLHGGSYNPNRYVAAVDEFASFSVKVR